MPLSTRSLANLCRRSFARRIRFVPLFVVAAVSAACGSDAAPTAPKLPAAETFAASLGVNLPSMTKKNDNLYIQDLKVGTGADAIVGRTLRVTYTGYLANGSKFDSNVGGSAFSFKLGAGQVIAGWDQGYAGMKVGGKRRLVIGSALGYGTAGSGSIPPNATLVFDVELLEVVLGTQ